MPWRPWEADIQESKTCLIKTEAGDNKGLVFGEFFFIFRNTIYTLYL